MVHGRNIPSPPPLKSHYFTELKKHNKSKMKSKLMGSYSNSSLTKFDEDEDDEKDEDWNAT